MSLCLTRDELIELTGHTWRKKQVRYFVERGVPHRVRMDGSPVVLRMDLEPKPPADDWKPPKVEPLNIDGPVSILWEPCVYFIKFVGMDGEATDGNVKIGYTGYLRNRRHQIAKEIGVWPEALRVLNTLPGDLQDERDLHDKFDKYRHAYEWFLAEPELMAFIDALHR